MQEDDTTLIDDDLSPEYEALVFQACVRGTYLECYWAGTNLALLGQHGLDVVAP
jgi:hypothetical protein